MRSRDLFVYLSLNCPSCAFFSRSFQTPSRVASGQERAGQRLQWLFVGLFLLPVRCDSERQGVGRVQHQYGRGDSKKIGYIASCFRVFNARKFKVLSRPVFLAWYPPHAANGKFGLKWRFFEVVFSPKSAKWLWNLLALPKIYVYIRRRSFCFHIRFRKWFFQFREWPVLGPFLVQNRFSKIFESCSHRFWIVCWT